jgi:hypothetical protein
MHPLRHRTLRPGALALCVAALVWFAFQFETRRGGTSAIPYAPPRESSETTPSALVVGPSERRSAPYEAVADEVEGPAPSNSASTSVVSNGELELRFRAREPLDCLRLSVLSSADEMLASCSVDRDVVLFSDLPPGAMRVDLSSVVGEALVRADVEIRSGERALLELRWPSPLPDRSAYALSGVLLVPQLIEEGVRGRFVQLELEPLMDTAAQQRAFSRSSALRLDRLRSVGAGRREFSFANLEPGSYELRLEPGCSSRTVAMTGPERLVRIEFDPGPLGRPLIVFRDEFGAPLRPASVRAARHSEQLTSCEMSLVYSPEFDAYDWLAAPGEWWLWVADSAGGVPRRAARFDGREGWSLTEVVLGSLRCAKVDIDGGYAALALSEFEALPLDGGGVLEVRLVHDVGQVGKGQLLVWVDRGGHYALRRTIRGGRVFHLEIFLPESAAETMAFNWSMD